MAESPMRKRFLDCKGMSMEDCEAWGKDLAEMQLFINFGIGDLQRYAEAKWPDTHHQIWPEWMSPGLASRSAGVCRAYPDEADRQIEATYSQYRMVAKHPDRLARLQAIVDEGLTTDESRKADQDERADQVQVIKDGKAQWVDQDEKPRWCLAVDVNYFLHRFWFSGAGVEAAKGVASWLERTVDRLKEKGLTDVVCAVDSKINKRKELTAGDEWEGARYKDRPAKDPELGQQLTLVHELLEAAGWAVVSIPGYEGDDVMASVAKQFPGRVTILSQDKDLRQCLSPTVNMLLDVEWKQDETSGDHLPEYKWLSAKQHLEQTGIPVGAWTDYQCIMGDNTDGIKGVVGIGEKGAADLIKEFGTLSAAIHAAHNEDDRIKPKKREALIEFKAKMDVTRKLVTLVDTLEIPSTTRL